MDADPEQAAALLQSPPGWSDANNLDERLQQLPGVGQAVAELYLGWAEALAENSGLTPAFGEALREAATAIGAVAQELQAVIGGGILRNGGSGSFPEARAQLPRPIPEKHQGKDPRMFVLGQYLAERNPPYRDGQPRRTG